MKQHHSTVNTLDVQAVKSAASGRELEILRSVGGIDGELLDKKGHPCPKCGGHDRFALIDAKAGAVHCRHCFSEKSGDFIAAVQWMRDCTFPEAVRLIGDYLGVNPSDNNTVSQSGPRPKGQGRQGQPSGNKPPFDRNNIIAEYLYTDADGQAVYKAMRDVHKNFMQARPDPANPDKWILNLKGVERVPYQLPTLLDVNRHTIYIVEGEKDADNLNRLFQDCEITDRVATTSAGGSNSAKFWPGFVEKYGLANKRVFVMPDNDTPGISFGRAVCKAFCDADCHNVKMVSLPVKDISDLIELRRCEGKQPIEIFQEVETLCQQAEPVTGETITQWNADASTPKTKTDEKEVIEPCPVDVLPKGLQGFVTETAAAIGVDVAFIVPFALSAVSGAMGRLFQIELKPGYRELPSIWAVVVASSGSGKSPALDAVLEPMRRFQMQADQSYKEQMADYEREKERYNEQKNNRKQKTSPFEPPQEKPVEPIAEQFLIDDATTEAVAEILEQNPYGVFLSQDELSGFFNGFDTYRGGAKGKDLSFWLSAFKGVPIRQNRKSGRKIISAPTPAIAICGGIQPGMLKKTFCENEHYFDSGLAARFLFVMPKERPVLWSENIVSESTKADYWHIMESLFALRKSGYVPADTSVIVSLSKNAKRTAWVPFFSTNASELVSISADDGRATWAKFPAYAARLALILHVVQWIESKHPSGEWPIDIPSEISTETMWAAIRLIEWFKSESARMLNLLGGGKTTCDREAMDILQAINKNGDRITVRELVRSRSRYQKPGGTEKAEKKLQEIWYLKGYSSPSMYKAKRDAEP